MKENHCACGHGLSPAAYPIFDDEDPDTWIVEMESQ